MVDMVIVTISVMDVVVAVVVVVAVIQTLYYQHSHVIVHPDAIFDPSFFLEHPKYFFFDPLYFVSLSPFVQRVIPVPCRTLQVYNTWAYSYIHEIIPCWFSRFV